MASDPPVEPGDTLTVTVETTGDEGDGISRIGDGFVLLVSGAATGETVTVEVEPPVFDSYAFATVISRGESPQRQSPSEDPQATDLAAASSKYEVRPDGR